MFKDLVRQAPGVTGAAQNAIWFNISSQVNITKTSIMEAHVTMLQNSFGLMSR
jgi:hypothetical protein